MKRIAFILLPLFVLAGCSVDTTPTGGDDDDSAKENLSEKTTPKKKKGSSTTTKDDATSTTTTTDTTPGATTETPAAPAGPDVTFVGTLAETELVAFGGITADGTEVCAVQQFKNVSITVVATEKGLVKSFSFKGTSVEEANPKCAGVTATPENEHSYTFTNAAPKDVPAKLVAAPGNKPQAQLIADVAVHADSGGRATINFHRTDAAKPLDWSYTVQFQLTKQ